MLGERKKERGGGGGIKPSPRGLPFFCSFTSKSSNLIFCGGGGGEK